MIETSGSKKFFRTAWILSGIGLFPFATIAIAIVYFGSDNAIVEPAFTYFKFYSAVVLSFMGGTRWGYSLRENSPEPEILTIIVSILPALIAWGVLLVSPQYNGLIVVVLLLCFCALGTWDSLSGNTGNLPRWYTKLRIYMTLAVAACHIAVFFVIGGTS